MARETVYDVEVLHATGTDYVSVARTNRKEWAEREARMYVGADAHGVRIRETVISPIGTTDSIIAEYVALSRIRRDQGGRP